jgi:hypothetical protein
LYDVSKVSLMTNNEYYLSSASSEMALTEVNGGPSNQPYGDSDGDTVSGAHLYTSQLELMYRKVQADTAISSVAACVGSCNEVVLQHCTACANIPPTDPNIQEIILLF